ncbi:plasmid pRiA4b ORF-3 family protein [Schlegelella sp. S2-27]|uniref:Plasmid pRiA4b ORF-3 family protein n=1 Tax=Caldimonas mangrovi TaxID=2944811 RepID=A0ABT0YPH4_9BURK|nr:plasmid pRiA4b ORF-3 family protein [Caldimonas mangrovi]MCM5680634.1 plasmid pRiA4b ORF-3 family protein [Caldimonas mangrovi]
MSKSTRRTEPQRIYQLTMALQRIEPRIWRTVLVPDTLSLAKLDRVLQAAMGWTGESIYSSKVVNLDYN